MANQFKLIVTYSKKYRSYDTQIQRGMGYTRHGIDMTDGFYNERMNYQIQRYINTLFNFKQAGITIRVVTQFIFVVVLYIDGHMPGYIEK